MLQFDRAGMFETEHLAALRIDARHDVLDRAVLAGRVHGLKDQQQRVPIGGVVELLQRAQALDVLLEQLG